MSLEECKRIADERLEKARAKIQYSDRHARGQVDGEAVEIGLYVTRVGFPRRSNWIVAVLSHKYWAISKKSFPRKKQAERYFEKLTREYDLGEKEVR